MIAIIDYNMGNVGSILKMLRRVGADAVLTSDPEAIAAADKLVLPGVGSFDTGMKHLRQLGLIEVLNARVLEAAVPILGICLGLQLFSRSSEEGSEAGLGWLAARTVRFRFDGMVDAPKIPHMGWNYVHPTQPHPVLEGLPSEPRFYFLHSYYVQCDSPENVICTSRYGHEFTSAAASRNIIGTQFHPEKSHKFGISLFRRFAVA